MTPTNEMKFNLKCHWTIFQTTDLIGYLKTAIIGKSKTLTLSLATLKQLHYHYWFAKFSNFNDI